MLWAENTSIGFPTRLIMKLPIEARTKNNETTRSQKSKEFELKFQFYDERRLGIPGGQKA